jgi:hypothetical protein
MPLSKKRETLQMLLLKRLRPLLLLALVTLAPLTNASNDCARSLGELLRFNSEASVLRATKRFPLGVDSAAHPAEMIQYGFESEYGLDEIAGLLKVYGPDVEFGVSKRDWLAMSDEARMNWVRSNMGALFPEKRKKGKLVKLSSEAKFKNLPERLIQDETGNIEIIVGPLDTLEDWYKVVKNTNDAFGAGSMQSTVSVSRQVFFGQLGAGIEENAVQENFGFLKFFADYDALQKLAGGYSKYQQDPTKEVAKSFQHPFLGPTNADKEARLLKDLRANERAEGFSKRHLSEISGSDASYKYTGATVYRPDIAGPNRIVLEVRDAHKDFARLTDKVLRTTYYLQNSRGSFGAASRLAAFDAEASFASLPRNVQAMLKKLYPNKAKPGVEYGAEEMKALDVFRNFAWPQRNWSEHLAFVGRDDLASQVADAQAEYLNTLLRVANGFDAKDPAIKVQASADVQGALAKFAQDSGLSAAFEEKYQSLSRVVSERARRAGAATRAEFQADAAIEVGALKAAFPSKIWQGDLKTRSQRFAEAWPRNVKLFSGVSFGGSKTKRSVLQIDLRGLDDTSKKLLMEEYFQAMSLNTVSFPMSEGVGHLHTRIGKMDMDWYGGASFNDYAMPGSPRMEPVVTLSPSEQLRLRVYMDNINKRDTAVLGDSDYDGVATGKTRGKLTNNKPTQSGEGHNCTSYMCLAPISDKGYSLYSMVGGKISAEDHTSPGEWGRFLAEESNPSRVPLLVYWKTDALGDGQGLPLRNGANITEWNW